MYYRECYGTQVKGCASSMQQIYTKQPPDTKVHARKEKQQEMGNIIFVCVD